MSQQSDTAKTIIFVIIMSVVCAGILSAVSSFLREDQKINKENDAKISILDSFLIFAYEDDKVAFSKDSGMDGFEFPQGKKSAPEAKKVVPDIFKNNISVRIISNKGVDLTDDATAKDGIKEGQEALFRALKDEKAMLAGKRDDCRLPFFIYYDDEGEVEAVAVQLWGKGLWGSIDAYMSLQYKDKDGNIDLRTIRGLTFLTDHKETPGLGKEMERENWRITFTGKRTHDDAGNLRAVTVIKGQVAGNSKYDSQSEHYVDGLSGATLTCNGISEMIYRCLNYYQPFIEKIRNKEIDLSTFKPQAKAGE